MRVNRLHFCCFLVFQVTLTWKPPASFGEASIVGYRLLNDRKAFRDDLDCETLSLSLNALEEGLLQKTVL